MGIYKLFCVFFSLFQLKREIQKIDLKDSV